MNIIYRPKFVNEFNNIWDYISLDSKNRANKFKKELRESIENIPNMPYRCRKSIYFNNDDIRDLVFKGYVLPYKIDVNTNEIIIIGINKYKSSL